MAHAGLWHFNLHEGIVVKIISFERLLLDSHKSLNPLVQFYEIAILNPSCFSKCDESDGDLKKIFSFPLCHIYLSRRTSEAAIPSQM